MKNRPNGTPVTMTRKTTVTTTRVPVNAQTMADQAAKRKKMKDSEASFKKAHPNAVVNKQNLAGYEKQKSKSK